jgi:UDP-GlcNAc:undecaprenyl-phosphate/decaprenyl-phosphate GlcNAc-1-phosphate transferase
VNRTLVVFSGALVSSVVATRAAGPVANRLGVVDRPGPLKPQTAEVPYLGGAGVLAGLLVGAGTSQPVLMVPLGLAAALGTADDYLDIPPSVRIAGQIAVGASGAFAVSTKVPAPVGQALVAGTTVVLMNGLNLIDGLDGLAAGTSAVAAGALALMLRGEPRTLAVALAAGCAGFLVYNRPPARIYLGDGGSYLIGAAISLLLASAWRDGTSAETSVASLLVAAVPVAEVAFAVVRRRRAHSALFAGDRGHPYDRLVRRGWSKTAAAAAYVAAEAALAGIALRTARSRSVAGPLAVAAAVTAGLFGLAGATGMLRPEPQEEPQEPAVEEPRGGAGRP